MTTTFRLTNQARSRTIGDEGVVILQDDAEVVITNESGAAMLEMCRDGATLELIAQMLVEKFGASLDQAQTDAARFVSELQESGIVEAEPTP